MSFNRENVTWQSPKDDRWRIGFFTCFEVGDPADEDFDPEWDVDYDFDSFEMVSTPFADPEAGHPNRTWWPNPGGTTIVSSDDPVAARYDELHAALRERAARARHPHGARR